MDNDVKAYKSYADQVQILEDRGMDMGDRESAAEILKRLNYYRLSGYWYPFRKLSGGKRLDEFFPGTRFCDVVKLYEFDARLRAATFAALAPIELAVRALIGHELGRIDPCIHHMPSLLGPQARVGDKYSKWLDRYQREVEHSREEFVRHHVERYESRLPVWVAVEVLDWGSLTQLYSFAPRRTQDVVAKTCHLSAPQLGSWLKALNLVRNVCAHHGRFFNRVHAITPKLPPPSGQERADLDAVRTSWDRTFGQLTLIQYLMGKLEVGNPRLLPAVLKSFPGNRVVPVTHTGAPANWERDCGPLWRSD